MKVLFLNPSRAGSGNIPLNIPILISILRRHGHKVRLFDFSDYFVFENDSYNRLFFKEAKLDNTQVMRLRKKFYKGKFDSNDGTCGLKKTDYRMDFRQALDVFKPDIIAVSCLSVDFKFACDFLSFFKEDYDIPVIFGGIHAVLLPEEALRSGAADFVCIGEGEKCFVDLLEAMEHNRPLEGISGIWYKLDGDIIKNDPVPLTDLSDLPPPDFADFDPIHFYRPFDGKRYKMLNYELSRGCPFSCSYCVNGVLKQKYKGLGPYHRTKELRQSIEELRFLIGKYHFDFIRFWDEDFTSISQDYLLDYAEAYVAQIGLPFIIYARTDTVTVEKVRILKYMGCVTFAMGIESGNAFIRNRIMNRQMSNRMIEERFKLVKSFGIRVSAYNIIGLPYENRKRIFDTIELNKRIAPDSLSVTLLEPYKATPIRKICVEQGLDPLYDVVSDPTHPQFVPKKMSAGELSGLFRAFPFYVRFSKDRYGEIRRAETDKRLWRRLHREFSKFK